MSGYDSRLLASAGEISKDDRQAGYNIDILNPPAPAQSPAPPARHGSSDGFTSGSPIPPPGAAAPAIVGGTNVPGSFTNKGMEGFAEDSNPYPKKIPFYRTRKGIIAIVAAVIIVIAIAVGVGAGVGANKGGKSTGFESTQTTTSAANSFDSVTVPNVSQIASSTRSGFNNPLGGSTTSAPAGEATASATDGTNVGGTGNP